MKFLDFFRARSRGTADTAKERLQILLAHERSGASPPDFLPRLHRELVELVAKYVHVDDDKISVNVDNSGTISTLEVNIELPSGMDAARV